MDCPKCGHTAAFAATECERCGVIFAKVSHSRTLLPRAYVIEEERVADGRIGPTEWKILAFGLGSAIVVSAIPFTRFIFSAIITLFHEFGHAVAGWLMGYPS